MAVGLMHATRFHKVVLVLAGLLCLGGCATQNLLSPKNYFTREKALKLIDEGDQLTKDGSPVLALERYNQAALIRETPDVYFKMGRIFEGQHQDEEAAKAYQQALRLAPDMQEARLGMLALGYTPEGYTPTKEDLALAADRAKKRSQQPAPAASAAKPAPAAPAAETPKSAEEVQSEREDVLTEAAKNRKPTADEVRSALFAPEAAQNKLPSATAPVYASDQDVILGSYPYHFQKAEQLRKRQQYDKAADEYERALRADPRQVDARLNLGDMLMKLERYDRARLHYERSLQDFPESPKPLLKLGNYYLTLKQPDRARFFYRKAIEKDSHFAEAYNNLAVMDMQEHKYKEATVLLDQIIKIDPSFQNAYLNRGIIANDVEHNRDLALSHYRKYVELGGPRAAQVRQWIAELENKER